MTDDTNVERIGNYLDGKKIALCISGGIAAIESPKVARHLRRYGAEVQAYVTPSAYQFVGKTALEWGTEKKVVDSLTGSSEHICKQDALLVCPATLNTINKIMQGIADNPVTALAASALGKRKPVFLVPTMHDSLYNNPFFQKNLDEAEKYGIHVIPAYVSEEKQKMPSLESIAAEVSRDLSSGCIKDKKLLITAGPTPVVIDNVRRITNVFTGKLGVAMAKEAYFQGADVTLLLGSTGIPTPKYVKVRRHHTLDEYIANVFDELKHGYDAGIFSAAVADYKPEKAYSGKIPSQEASLDIHLVPTMKVIQEVRKQYPGLFMTTFKFESGISMEELRAIADRRISQGYDLVVANREEDMIASHHAIIVGKEGMISSPGSKADIAAELIRIMGYKMHSLEPQSKFAYLEGR